MENLIDWIKPDGTPIATNDMKTTVAHCQELGWRRADEPEQEDNSDEITGNDPEVSDDDPTDDAENDDKVDSAGDPETVSEPEPAAAPSLMDGNTTAKPRGRGRPRKKPA